jgi:hypothetical protein
MQSCIHRVVPLNPTEHRYSVAYFLRAEDETMFTDSNGRFISAGQWHDEKFYTFMSPEEEQAKAPSYLLLGGMAGEGVDGEIVKAEDGVTGSYRGQVKAY